MSHNSVKGGGDLEVCQDDMVKISRLGLYFGLPVDCVYGAMLKRGNKISKKILHFGEDGKLFTSEAIYRKILRVADSIQNRVVDMDVLLDLADYKIPFERGAFVYFLFQDDVLVYIGQTTNIVTRISSHLDNKDFDRVATVEVADDELNLVEGINIMEYKPIYNIYVMDRMAHFRLVLRHALS